MGVVVALVAIAASVAAPSTASAFVGEGLVVDAGGGLTKAAETVIKQGKTVPELVTRAGAYGGAEEASVAAGGLEVAGVLPVLGSLVAAGAGVGVGSVICHAVGIDGCWFYSVDEASPAFSGGVWVRSSSAPGGPYVQPAYEGPGWYWRLPGASYPGAFVFRGLGGYLEDAPGGAEPPAAAMSGADLEVEAWEAETMNCESAAGCRRALVYRLYMEGRSLQHVSDSEAQALVEGGATDAEYEAPAQWAQQLGGELEGHEGDGLARLGQGIAAEIPGSGVQDPYAREVQVPDCEGLDRSACVGLLEELDLRPRVEEFDWQDAQVEELDKEEPWTTREQEAERVVELDPPPETTIETGEEVEVVANPAEEGMPLWVPEPGEGEKADEYEENKMVPGGAWVPSPHEVSGDLINPDRGPGEVARTSPAEGARLDPSTSHDLDVYANPPGAPVPAGSGTCSAALPAFDLSPLNQPVGSRFPFGVVGFFVGWVGEWASEYQAPQYEMTVIPAGVFGSSKAAITLDLAAAEPMMGLVRAGFLLLSFVGLLWFMGTAAMKVQGDSS